jgi:ankyrin repeat protein
MAAQRGDYEAVELLVEAGADPTVNNGAQYTPADVARVEDGDVQVLELIMLNFWTLSLIALDTIVGCLHTALRSRTERSFVRI